jgi:tetratricopeptide (TPR) repeat protein
MKSVRHNNFTITHAMRGAIVLARTTTKVFCCAVMFSMAVGVARADEAADCAQVQDADRAIKGCTARIGTLERLQAGAITGIIAGGVFGDAAIARALNSRGNAYTRKSNFRAAIADYNRAIGLASGEAIYVFNRGTALANLSEWPSAINDFTRALALRPVFAEALSSRAVAFVNVGETGKALQDAESAIRIAPGKALSLYARGRAFGAAGRIEEAVVDLRKALFENPSFTEAGDAVRRLGYDP